LGDDPARSAEGAARSRESAGRKLEAGAHLVLASHNAGKLAELRAMLAPFGITVTSAGELGLPEPPETGTTFHENAALKALAAARATNLPALADDSGCEIAALNGAPGVHTADWAAQPDGTRDYAAAMARVAREAGDNPDRRAAFVSVLCLAFPDGHTQFHEGRVDGHWVYPPRGTQGFGFDPMFVPEDAARTYGEMTPAEKARTNHRGRAFAAFARACLPG
jgi:XTP/dITP diphosphohydrolase